MSDPLSHKGSVRAPGRFSTFDTNYQSWIPSISHYREVTRATDLKTSERKIMTLVYELIN